MVSAELSESKRKIFEGFSSNPELVVNKLTDTVNQHTQKIDQAAQFWFRLHLELDDSVSESISLWPENKNFSEFVQMSQVTQANDSMTNETTEGFLAFHRLADYDHLEDFYSDPYKINFATGSEQDSENAKSIPLTNQLLKNLLAIYFFVNEVTESFTETRLELEILKDQIIALDFAKNNGYFVRHLTEESADTLLSIHEPVTDLFKQSKLLRTHVLLPVQYQISAMIHAVGALTYPTTTEFKKDFQLFVQQLKTATPQISSFLKNLNELTNSLKNLKTRSDWAQKITHEDTPKLKNKVDELFNQLEQLIIEEKIKINEDHPEGRHNWALWLAENQEEYSRIFYELYEILDYQYKKDSVLYNFQTKNFKLNSKQREIFRSLEALMFGFNDLDNIHDNKLDGERMNSKFKFRSHILNQIIRQKQMGCDSALL